MAVLKTVETLVKRIGEFIEKVTAEFSASHLPDPSLKIYSDAVREQKAKEKREGFVKQTLRQYETLLEEARRELRALEKQKIEKLYPLTTSVLEREQRRGEYLEGAMDRLVAAVGVNEKLLQEYTDLMDRGDVEAGTHLADWAGRKKGETPEAETIFAQLYSLHVQAVGIQNLINSRAVLLEKVRDLEARAKVLSITGKDLSEAEDFQEAEKLYRVAGLAT